MSDKGSGGTTSPEMDALKALAKQVPPANCPICKNLNWTIESEPGGILSSFVPMPGLLGFKSSTLAMSPVVPTLVLTCESCGFIRQHSIPTLLKIRENGNG